VSDAGLAHLKACKNLMQLFLSNTKVSDAGLAHFKDCKNLWVLYLENTKVTDAGLTDFKDWKNLSLLNLGKTDVSDAGLAHLKACKKLLDLDLRVSKVSAAGVGEMQKALPKCNIQSDYPPEKAERAPKKEDPALAVAPFNAKKARAHQGTWAKHLSINVEMTNSIGMKFVWIPPGSFMMGSPKEEIGRDDNEIQHKVTLSKGFYMGVYTVTREKWRAVLGKNPSGFKGEKNLPVVKVSWDDCQEFCKKLSEKDKRPYRLPTEAEWEYACRAGTTKPFHFGETISTDQANFRKQGTVAGKMAPVGRYPANAFGLYDMHGNVYQWCQDWVGVYPQEEVVDPVGPNVGSLRVMRGGWYADFPQRCRSASRAMRGRGDRVALIGLRIVCAADPKDGAQSDDGTKPKEVAAEPAATDPDRRAAEWVLSIGGIINFMEDGVERQTRTVAGLPRGAIELTSVELSSNPKVSDSGLGHFKDCKNLTYLSLGGTKVTSKGLLYFKECKNLTQLFLQHTKVTDTGLAHFKNCKELTRLCLGGTKVTDKGFLYFKDCNNLMDLLLYDTKVTDAGLAQLKDCKNLTMLNLNDTKVSDVGLIHLKVCKNLTMLDLYRTKTTAAGVGKLQKALPKCKIEWR
jgi:formylglycine-generating enzyme required for sulfatase activity/Leucine-rich repeat (LRR) protein